jgi:hypothetical protein
MVTAVAAMTLGFAPVFAQDASIRVKAPSPAPPVTPPTLQYEVTRPSDDNYTLGGARIIYDPAFFRELSSPIETPTSTGRIGLAGWTTPNLPLGGSIAGFSEINGWLGFGFAVSWGGPPPQKPSTRRPQPKDAGLPGAIDTAR